MVVAAGSLLQLSVTLADRIVVHGIEVISTWHNEVAHLMSH